MTMAKTLRLESTIHPLTDFLRRSPVRRGRKQECPLLRSSLTRTLVRIPCFMGNPCLSLPPAILRTYPYKKVRQSKYTHSKAIKVTALFLISTIKLSKKSIFDLYKITGLPLHSFSTYLISLNIVLLLIT